jgi:uncharacterized protein (DUF1697 family)
VVPRYVGLLRGVNVGGKNIVAMSELRSVVESLGHTNVSTFIQSGNVIFTTSRPVTSKSLESAIEKQFDIDITVVLRTAPELASVVKANPFADVDTSKLHVGFMATKPSAADVSKLDGDQFAPEEFVVHGTELYLHLPNGMGRTKLPGYLDRRLKVPTTVRTWKSVTKLVELATISR